MGNRKNKRSLVNVVMGVIGAIVVVIAAYFGIDLSDNPDFQQAATEVADFFAEPDPTQPGTLPEQNTPVAAAPGSVRTIALREGFGATKSFWQVYFTEPTLNDADAEDTCMGGVDEIIVSLIENTQRTLDIAAFEWKNACITRAVIDAAERGVQVRMVVDDEHVVEENEEYILEGEVSPFQWIIDAGIPWRDDDRSALMHNKFMIFDGTLVTTGSMNYTPRGTYSNNNNVVVLRSQPAVRTYQDEFNEMYVDGIFGPRGARPNDAEFTQDGIPIRVVFSPDDPVETILAEELSRAQEEIRFMTFSFTLESIGVILLENAAAGIDVEGIFETRASETEFSELPRLFCAGLPVYQDGNSETFHHKVFIVDRTTVLTGSFNISNNATTSNDENMVIIRDPDLAAQFIAEYERMRARARVPDGDFACP
ncbi:MAG: phospholipase D-like domain-containing protein [Chloroflexota bacterium]